MISSIIPFGGAVRAEIISCGTELLLGHITDTNATFLAQSLSALGIDLYFVSQVGDNLGRIVETLRRAWKRSDLLARSGLRGEYGCDDDQQSRKGESAARGPGNRFHGCFYFTLHQECHSVPLINKRKME